MEENKLTLTGEEQTQSTQATQNTNNESVRREDGSIDIRNIQNPPEKYEAPEAQPTLTEQLPSIESFFQQSESEKQQDSIANEILGLTQNIQGKDNFQLEANERFGVNEQSGRLADLQGQMGIAATKFNLIPEDVAIESTGRQRSAAAGANITSARQRRAQRDYLVLGATAQAVQGKLDNAKDLVRQAVEVEYREKEQNLETLKTFFNLNESRLAREDSKRATALQIQLQERERQLEEEKALDVQRETLAVNVLANGGTREQAEAIRLMEDPVQAYTEFGDLAISPDVVLAKKQFNEALRANQFSEQFSMDQFNYQKYTDQLARDLQKAEINAIKAQTAQAEEQMNLDLRIQAGDQVSFLNTQLEGLSALVNHPGMNSSVGAGIFDGKFSLLDKATGADDDFNALMSQVLSQKTLDELIDVKNRGGTFGALSDGERLELANAATAINAARLPNGKINMTESEWIRQMGLIQKGVTSAINKKENSLASFEQTQQDVNDWDNL